MRPLRRAAAGMLSRVRGLPRSRRSGAMSDRPSVARGGAVTDDRANAASDVQGDLRRGDPGATRSVASSATTRRSRSSTTTRDWPALFAREEARIRSILGDRVVRDRAHRLDVGAGARGQAGHRHHAASSPTPRRAGLRPGPRGGRLPPLDPRASPTGTTTASSRAPTRTSTSTSSRPGCLELERMVGFRDWLRTHDDDRELYERTKRELVDARLGVRPELRRREERRSSRRSRRGPGCRRGSTEAGHDGRPRRERDRWPALTAASAVRVPSAPRT